MSRTTKPYRRYRTRGREDEVGGGLDELRELTARQGGDGAPPHAPGRNGAPPAPGPRRPTRTERRRRRALKRQGRRWYSLRGLGPGGWIGRIAIVLLLAVLAWAGFGYRAIDDAVGQANSKISKSARAALDKPSGGMLGTAENTLILGVDARPHEKHSRADTILIMRTDPGSGHIKYLSIPRDFRVELPRYGTQKINAAFYFFGQAGMIRAVKRLTGVPVNHLIIVHFNGFSKIVDALGGVTVHNPTALMNCPYTGGITVSFPAGQLDMNGARALQYARARKGACGGDLGRAMRQQALVAAMKNEVLSPTNIWRAPWAGASVVRALQTDIGTMDMIKMGWLQARLDQPKSDRILLTGEPQMIGNISYVVPTDPDRNEREIAAFMSSK